MIFDSNNFKYEQKWYFFYLILYLSLIVSFYFGENSTGGAIVDYINQKKISEDFSKDFYKTLVNYDKYSTRHSPVLIIFLSIFEKIEISDYIIRFIHLNLTLILPIFLFKTLKVIIKDKNIVFFLVSLIFISPTFRSLAIWPDSRILGLSFFVICIYEFIKFKNNKKFIHCVKNIIFLSISSYLSPNFSLFAIFFFIEFFFHYKDKIKYLFAIILINISLAIPAFVYLFSLESIFILKTAATNLDTSENLLFKNPFNKILLISTITSFYLLPFYILKIYKLNTLNKSLIKNIILSAVIFFTCALFFDYQYKFSGGGIFFKFSQYAFNNNYLFYLISFFSIILLLDFINFNIKNFLLIIILILSNPQLTIYHKYYDPLLIILFFTLFNIKIDIKIFRSNKNLFYIFLYFFLFLIANNLKLYVQ